MKKILILIVLAFSIEGCIPLIVNEILDPKPKNPTLDKNEALEAFSLLNEIRINPNSYHEELKFSVQLDSVTKTKLVWNDTLAKVAETKALDMANRNYFAHVDPDGFGINYFINQSDYKLSNRFLADKSQNNFESLGGGYNNGTALIKGLIIDKNTPSLGHRKHLLGIGSYYASLVDIGIGFVKGSKSNKYNSYACVIIAKHL